MDEESDAAFKEGVLESFLMILMAEIGDKTFLMVMLLASKSYNKCILWTLAVLAETMMNMVSVSIGATVPLLIPKSVVEWAVCALFIAFGTKLLWGSGIFSCKEERAKDDSSVFSEMSEAEEAIERMEELRQKREPLLP